jgi:hypothetical protein
MVMTNRFDLEQQILECWKVTEDITMMAKQNASTDSLNALSTYYEHKFNQLWETFGTMCHERQFNEPNPPQL